jgi:hypothetical protein
VPITSAAETNRRMPRMVGLRFARSGLLLGAYEQTGTHFIFSLPEIAWEASLAIHLIAKGFKPSPILA